MNKKLILSMVFILLFFITGCNSQTPDDPAIASVNGEIITQSEFDKHYGLIKNDYETRQGAVLDETQDQEIIDQIKSSAYDDLIIQKLIRQDAQKQGISIDPTEVDGVLESFKQARNNAETDGYQKFLDNAGITEKDLWSQIEISRLYDKLVEDLVGNITISDEDAQKYYNENLSQFTEPGGIEIYHILVDTEEQAAEVMSKVKQGEDFAALAQQYSQDSGSKDNGGDVGVVNEETNFVPEFKEAALTLQPGQVYAEPVKSDYGYHIIKAGDRIAEEQISFEQVEDDIKQNLAASQKQQAFSNYIDQLKNSADIEDLRQK